VRRLMRSEGLLVGGSCGSSLSGALRWLKDTEEGRRVARTEGANVVVLLPDGLVLLVRSSRVRGAEPTFFRIRNYMSKPWFHTMAMEAEPSPLALLIKDVLGSNSNHGS
jgi:cystathionine beta-synthase